MQEESGTQERRKETEIIFPATLEDERKPGSVTPVVPSGSNNRVGALARKILSCRTNRC
jgi:hypothetical protein